MSADARVGTPGADGTFIAAAGDGWDAVKLPRALGAAVLSGVAADPGAVAVSPGNRSLYFLIPPGAAASWDLPPTVALGSTSHIALPPPHRNRPPGPYWLIPPRRGQLHTRADDLRRAVETALGMHPDRPGADQPDLAHLTAGQIRGSRCALCRVRLHKARRLGMFWTGEGALAEPTDLWACDPHCGPGPTASPR